MKTVALFASFSAAAFLGTCLADDPKEKDSPERAAVAANDRAYEAAYAKGDVKALADFFSDDAEYTSDDGQKFSGRAEIEGSIRSALSGNKGAKLTITLDSVKVLAPEVVIEKGSTSVTSKDGDASGALYTAIYVKKDGKWKINQLVETPLPSVSAHEHLQDLEWLIGDWEDTDKTDNTTVRSQNTWARGGNFITRNITVKRGTETTLEGWQIIGWDPVWERIRSWTFDSEGGFSDGTWTGEGDHWLLRETGVTPDGGRTGSDNTFNKRSNDRITWESTNRTLDGEPQPGIGPIEVNRAKGN